MGWIARGKGGKRWEGRLLPERRWQLVLSWESGKKGVMINEDETPESLGVHP